MSKKQRIRLLGLAILSLLIVVGIFIRFNKIDDKEFWHDEAYTGLVLSGRTINQLKQELSARPCHMSDVRKYCVLNDKTDAASILHVLGEDEPGHAPLFYFLEWIFCGIFGTTPATMRLVSAFISVLTLPVIYWLALETYRSRDDANEGISVTAALTTAFASLSPLLVYYAQEARDYSLGVLFMTLSTTLLLFALRSAKRIAWVIYALSLALGLYSWLFTTVIIGGHILYVAITQTRSKTIWMPFAGSIATALLVAAPWLFMFGAHAGIFSTAYTWIQSPISKAELPNVWMAIPYKAFALFGFKTAKLATPLLLLTILQVAAVALSAIPFKNNRYVHISIIAVWFVIFAGQDVLMEGARSAVFRYQTAVIICILLLFPSLILFLWNKNKVMKGVALILVTLIFGIELLSDNYMVNCKIWPDKAINMRFTLPIAAHLNRDSTAYLVVEESSINPAEILDLSYQTQPDCTLIYRRINTPQPIPPDAKILYLWNPTEALQAELKSRYDITDDVDKFPYLKRAVQKI